jgi:uncharacterized LabA/DUF88 family protein
MQIQFRAQNVGENVAIALDVQNLYHGSKLLYKSKIAYQEFIDRILNGRKLIRAMAYVTTVGRGQSSFLGLLRNIGCDVKEKRINVVNGRVKCDGCGADVVCDGCGAEVSSGRQAVEMDGLWKCDWGVEIAIDALALAPKIDTFILASGDGHFAYLLDALKMAGVRTEVVSFKENTSAALIKAADHYNDIGIDLMMSEQPREEEEKKKEEDKIEEVEDEEIEDEEEYYEDDEED